MRAGRAGIKPEIVIAAAAEIADESGWSHATLANVAGKLEIKTPSLYNHVKGLADLRHKLAVHGVQLLRDVMFDAAIGETGKEAIRKIAIAYVDFVRTHPGLYEAINRVDDSAEPDFAKASDDLLSIFGRLLRPLALSEEEMVHVVRGLRSLVHGFASLEAMGGFQMPEDTKTSLTKAINYYFDGIAANINQRPN
ncbi:TetR-like C-terminal domain-containing protein [Cohnella kolymensis]|uniref:TetR-like C-terminal domain-containing protein n=1 Tax=Cohnella kolymensis TaxID=1590652 RepID=UPI00069754F1|nr:TetR-like C-terminal domain-containing protein [Cohnella kolymensis]